MLKSEYFALQLLTQNFLLEIVYIGYGNLVSFSNKQEDMFVSKVPTYGIGGYEPRNNENKKDRGGIIMYKALIACKAGKGTV